MKLKPGWMIVDKRVNRSYLLVKRFRYNEGSGWYWKCMVTGHSGMCEVPCNERFFFEKLRTRDYEVQK